MSMKEIDNEMQQGAMCTQYTINHVDAVEFPRKRKHEHSTSRTFIRLLRRITKRQDNADDEQ